MEKSRPTALQQQEQIMARLAQRNQLHQEYSKAPQVTSEQATVHELLVRHYPELLKGGERRVAPQPKVIYEQA